MSLHASVDVPHQRYWEFTSFHIKAGHEREWNELVKLYVDGFSKFPDAHWAMFESKWGENNGGLWVIINPMRTLGEVDKGMADGKAFFAAQGEANMKHAGELAAACIESVQTNLFVVNAKESYVDAAGLKPPPKSTANRNGQVNTDLTREPQTTALRVVWSIDVRESPRMDCGKCVLILDRSQKRDRTKTLGVGQA